MIRGDNRVILPIQRPVEHGVCRDRALYLDICFTQCIYCRPEYKIFFVPEQSIIGGVRIQGAEREARTSEIPVGFER